MSNWLMNFLFRRSAGFTRLYQYNKVDNLLNTEHCQTHLLKSLSQHEDKQREQFETEHTEFKSKEFLEKVQARALSNLLNKNISLADYYKIKHMVNDLKKVKFAQNYDGCKVNYDVGRTKERELLHLFNSLTEQRERNERGEIVYNLMGRKFEKDAKPSNASKNFLSF